MPENNVEIMETVNTTANEVIEAAKVAKDNTGAIMMGVGFVGGVALIGGLYILKTKVTKKRCEKAAKQLKESINSRAEEAEE